LKQTDLLINSVSEHLGFVHPVLQAKCLSCCSTNCLKLDKNFFDEFTKVHKH